MGGDAFDEGIHGFCQSGRGVLQRTYSFSDFHVIANNIITNFDWFYEYFDSG